MKKQSKIGRMTLYIISGTVVFAMVAVMVYQRTNYKESKMYSILTLNFFLSTGIACCLMLFVLIRTI